MKKNDNWKKKCSEWGEKYKKKTWMRGNCGLEGIKGFQNKTRKKNIEKRTVKTYIKMTEKTKIIEEEKDEKVIKN